MSKKYDIREIQFFLIFDPFLSIFGVGFGSHQAEQPYDFVAFSSLSPKAREAKIAENTALKIRILPRPDRGTAQKWLFGGPKSTLSGVVVLLAGRLGLIFGKMCVDVCGAWSSGGGV